jgi:hypothetical protein
LPEARFGGRHIKEPQALHHIARDRPSVTQTGNIHW